MVGGLKEDEQLFSVFTEARNNFGSKWETRRRDFSLQISNEISSQRTIQSIEFYFLVDAEKQEIIQGLFNLEIGRKIYGCFKGPLFLNTTLC